jgi:hypothetical protein
LAALAAGTTIAAAAPASLDEARPSFRCGAGLNPVERMICGDSELRAYDRAMALAFASRRRTGSPTATEQRRWLDERNACRDRNCVHDAYREWFGDFDRWKGFGRPLARRGPPPPDGSDLMLADLQSPVKRVDSLGHSGALAIRPVGGGWFLFRATATYTYDPHDGRGANISTSDAHGVVRIAGGTGRHAEAPVAGEQHPCRIAFTRLPRGAWKLVEEGICSGLGSSLTGIYRP